MENVDRLYHSAIMPTYQVKTTYQTSIGKMEPTDDLTKMDDFYNEPKLIKGGIATDERGTISFCNAFEFHGIKRFYAVDNWSNNIRAWHGHKMEHKFVWCASGAAIVAAAKVTDWDKGFLEERPLRWCLSAMSSDILHIPSGWANGFRPLTGNCILMFFSTSTFEQSKDDDFRFSSNVHDEWCWNVAMR